MSDDDTRRREMLLGQLRRLNRRLAAHGVEADLTPDDLATKPLTTIDSVITNLQRKLQILDEQ